MATDDLGSEGPDTPIGLGESARKAFQSHKVRFDVDPKGLEKLNTEFNTLNTRIEKFTTNIGTALAAARDFNNEIGALTGVMAGSTQGVITTTGGSTKSGGIQKLKDLTTGRAKVKPDHIGSGDKTPISSQPGSTKSFGERMKTAFLQPGSKGQAPAAMVFMAGLLKASAQNIKGRAEYTLEADRTGLLFRQMYGGTQLQYQSKWRQPMTDRMLGPGGIATMMNLQPTMGINPASMAAGVEGIRVASGFGYSTADATSMISALAQPGSANLMTLMLGTSLYAPGGKARDPMDVVRDVVQRMGLTSESMVQGAFQPGSMTRANLARTGLPMDMQNLVLQYAQENIEFQKKGGRGMYDPSNERDRSRMGIDNEYAMERERTSMAEVDRAENFYRKQVDNYAALERNTERLISVFARLEDVLSPLIGAQVSVTNNPIMRAIGGGAGMLSGFMQATGGLMLAKGLLGGAATFSPLGGALLAGGMAINALGDEEGGEPANITQPGMDVGFKGNLRAMARAAQNEGHHLTLSSGVRNDAEQSAIFFKRMRLDPSGKTVHNGQRYSLKSGNDPATGKPWAYVAPPGGSLHGVGLAADLGPRSAYPWIKANAARFGLRTASDEPWHVAPANMTMAKYRKAHPHGSQTSGTGYTGIRTSARPPAGVTSGGMHALTKDLSISDSIKAIESASGGVGDDGGGGGSVITIAPVIHLNGSSNDAADAQRLAQRVIHMIETSEAVRSLRRS